MTDEEVVKAKKIIKDLHSYCFLTQPTYRKMGYSFNEGDFERLNEQIDEINRQRDEIKQKDTEIDILIRKNETLKDEVLELREEIERLQDIDKRLGEDVDLKLDYIYTLEAQLKTVKSETIKEVAARLRKYIKFDINNDVYIKGADVDKVLNEME